jgi:ABC-type glycerol-3-phosphate transport system substrate-binding protein
MHMPVARLSLATLALLGLVACGGAPGPADEEDAEQAKEEAAALGRDTDETAFDDLIQTQDKARAVEGVTLGHKDTLDQALEAAEGNGDTAEE